MDLRTQVDALLAHTGLDVKIAAKEEARRNAARSDARAKKRAAIAKFIAERDRLQTLLNAADEEQKTSQKRAETAMLTWIKVREQFSTVHDELTRINAELDVTLRQNQDPAIAAFAEELAAMKAGATTPIRIRAIVEAMEANDRLKVHPDIDDVSAEIARLRKGIPPEATP